MPPAPDSSNYRRLSWAWVALCLALALHVTDEALTGFLTVYNPTVLVMRARYSWFPMPVFEFKDWLTGLIFAVIVFLALSPLFFRGARWVRPIGYFLAILNIFNAMGHTMATIFGRTVASVHFSRPAPGFYSSPFLLAAAIYMLYQLRATKESKARQQATV